MLKKYTIDVYLIIYGSWSSDDVDAINVPISEVLLEYPIVCNATIN